MISGAALLLRRFAFRAVVVTAFAALGSAACGGASVPLDPGKKVSGLSSSEVDAFCKDASRAMSDDDLRRVICSMKAQVTLAYGDAKGADRVTACDRALEECLAVKEDVSPARSSCSLKRNASACQVTVRELKACLDDTAVETKKIAEAFSCAKAVTTTSVQAIPKSCAAIAESCPLVDVPTTDEAAPVKARRIE